MDAAVHIDVRLTLGRFDLDVRWEARERFLGVFGHSGAGKTTLLETVAGLRRPASGSIRVHGSTWLDSARGIDLPPERRGVGYVPQDTLLFPHRDVMGNLLAGSARARRSLLQVPSPERVLEVLELQNHKNAPVSELSGGERQRVALGRAILSGAELLLLDEPLASLDLPLRRRILPFLLRVQEQFAIPSLTVSHDVTEMKMLSREVLVLDRGRVLATGAPEEVFLKPSILPMFREDGFENVLQGNVGETKDAGLLLELEPELHVLGPKADLPLNSKALVSLRADEVLVAVRKPVGLSAQNVLPGKVLEIRELAGEGEGEGAVLVVVGMGRGNRVMVASITKQARQRLSIAPGVPVYLVFKAQSCRVLSAG